MTRGGVKREGRKWGVGKKVRVTPSARNSDAIARRQRNTTSSGEHYVKGSCESVAEVTKMQANFVVNPNIAAMKDDAMVKT